MQAKLVGAMVELLQKYESLLGGVVVVRAVRDALVSEGVRLYSTGTYVRGDHYVDAGLALDNELRRLEPQTISSKEPK
jgi:hypothetical protein